MALAVGLHRFEVKAPSLHQIFVKLVQGLTGEGGAEPASAHSDPHPLAAIAKGA